MQAWIANNNILIGTKEELVKYISAEKLLEPPYALANASIINLKEYLLQQGLQAQINDLEDELDILKCQETSLADSLTEVRQSMSALKRQLAHLHLKFNAI